MSRCIKQMELDLRDHIEAGTIYKRKAARGIIRHGDKYLAIHGKYGDYKFPGGGMEPGESLTDTLLREVQEETGYRVIPESIGDYLLVHEKRNGDPEDWLEMDSWYYFCDVEERLCERHLDAYEKEYDYRVMWMTLTEMLQKNEAVTDCSKIPWVTREAMVMRALEDMTQESAYSMPVPEIIDQVTAICKANGVKRLDLFGSFATGTATPRSDIDFVVYGCEDMMHLEEELSEIDTLRKIDVFDHDSISNRFLLEDIRKYGKQIY